MLITNVSRLGVGFVSTAAMKLGEQHRLRIGRGPMCRYRIIRVIVCRQTGEREYAVGAEFVDTGARTLLKAG